MVLPHIGGGHPDRDRTVAKLFVENEEVKLRCAVASLSANGSAYNRWLTCPLETGEACVVDPYFDTVGERNPLMTSIAFPLKQDGKVIGVMGLDISLDNLQQLSLDGRRELFDGQGGAAVDLRQP